MTDLAVTETLGELLSPSKATMYLTCPAKWYFRYLIGLSEPTTGVLALGKVFRGTLAQNLPLRSVKPKAIETVQGEITGVKVRGIVDLLDVDGCVFDFKTASKRPNGISPEHCLQLTTYEMITPEASGLCRLAAVTRPRQ